MSLQNWCSSKPVCKRAITVVNGRYSLTQDRRNEAVSRWHNIYDELLLKFLYLLGLLQGDGLDRPEELVLRVLSGLLSEHIRSIFKVLWQASQSRLPLHLVTKWGRHGSRVRRYSQTSQTLHSSAQGHWQRVCPISWPLHFRGWPLFVKAEHLVLTLWVNVWVRSLRHRCHY